MRVTLNLSSRPYVELRPVLVRLRMLAGMLAVVALLLWVALRSLEHKAAVADANVSHWTHQTQALEHEWQQDQAMMQQPQNAATLETSDFLNNLFSSKAFSWTAALMDLENVLPGGVQVVSIEPQMTKDGRVQLRLRVSGPRDKSVDLVKNLEKSKHFLNPRLVGETAEQSPTARPGQVMQPSASADVNFDILAEYNPHRMDEVTDAAETHGAKKVSATNTLSHTKNAAPAAKRKPGAR